MTPAELTSSSLVNLAVVERVCSALSLLGCLFIAATFASSSRFRRPINKLVFYASMGNIFTNVATLISRDFIEAPNTGICQFQAFLIQMFMPADAYWTLAMALNVYLTFYYHYGADQLRALEKYYLMACYGVPFIPAFAYLWINTDGRGRIYGDATLWCWIADNWDPLRVGLFYGPVWIVILVTSAIYIRTGRKIFRKRKELRNFNRPPPSSFDTSDDPVMSVKTEFHMTSETVGTNTGESIELRDMSEPKYSTGKQLGKPVVARLKNAYSVTVSSPDIRVDDQEQYSNSTLTRPKSAKLKNIKDSFSNSRPTSSSKSIPRTRNPTMEANTASYAYTKVAGFFFIAMMVTWIPSSANRVYSLAHPGEISLPLEFASAFVLPLQGFWNAVIYTMTSWRACKRLSHDIAAMFSRPRAAAKDDQTTLPSVFDGSDHSDSTDYHNSGRGPSLDTEQGSLLGSDNMNSMVDSN